MLKSVVLVLFSLAELLRFSLLSNTFIKLFLLLFKESFLVFLIESSAIIC